MFRATGPINLSTPGLLALFGLKTFGAAPQDLGNVVQLNADIVPHLIGGQRETFNINPTVSLVGNTVLYAGGLIVPAGEAWLIDIVGVQAFLTTPNAGVSATFTVMMAPQGNQGQQVALLTTTRALSVPSSQIFHGVVVPRFVAAAGTLFGVAQMNDGSAAFTTAPITAIQLGGIRLKA